MIHHKAKGREPSRKKAQLIVKVTRSLKNYGFNRFKKVVRRLKQTKVNYWGIVKTIYTSFQLAKMIYRSWPTILEVISSLLKFVYRRWIFFLDIVETLLTVLTRL